MGFMDRFRVGPAPQLPTTSESHTSRDAALGPTPRDSIVGNHDTGASAVPYASDHVHEHARASTNVNFDHIPGGQPHTSNNESGVRAPVLTSSTDTPVTNEKPLPQQPSLASEQPLNGNVAGNNYAWTPTNRYRCDEEAGPGAQVGATAPTTSTRKHTMFGRLLDRLFHFTTTDPFGPRPTFTTWLKIYFGDILTLFLLGMLSLGLLLWSPLPRFKYFPIYTDTSQSNLTPGDELVYPQFAAPKMSQHIPIVADALIAVFAPFIVVWIMNIFVVHSFWDVNNACIGTVVAVMTGCVIQIIIKLVVVGLRPHFLTVCNPMSPSEALAQGVHPKGGFGGLYYGVDVCREKDGKKLANAMQSFPSGHSSAAWAGLLYLSLYLNGKLKPFSNYHPSWWKFLAIIAPMVSATLLVGSLTLDMSHNWYDIAVGSIIGSLVAIGSYRMTYASVMDWRWSHVPLPRGNMYVLGTGASSEGHALEKGWLGARAMREGYRKREGDGLGFSMEEMDMWSGYTGTGRGGWRRGGATFGAGGDCSAMWRAPDGAGLGGRYTGDDRNGALDTYGYSGYPSAGQNAYAERGSRLLARG